MANSTWSWGTYPISFLKSLRLYSAISLLLSLILPVLILNSLNNSLNSVVLPAPVTPTIPSVCPFSIANLISLRSLLPSSNSKLLILYSSLPFSALILLSKLVFTSLTSSNKLSIRLYDTSPRCDILYNQPIAWSGHTNISRYVTKVTNSPTDNSPLETNIPPKTRVSV